MFRLQRIFRVIVGLAAMFAFSASMLEVLIPDVHDGDAGAVLIAGATHNNDSTPTSPPTAPAGSHHAQHVDHCSHAHVAAIATALSIDVTPVCHEARPNSGASALVSVALTPSLRPPIL